MKHGNVKKLILVVGLMLCLGGCDKGAKSLGVAKDDFADLINAPELKVEQMQKAQAANLVLTVLSNTYADNASGKEAAQLLDSIQSKSERLRERLMKDFDQAALKAASFFDAPEMVAKKILNHVAKHQKKERSLLAPFPFKTGDCFASVSGGEFSKKTGLERLRLGKVKVVGKDEVIVQEYMHFSESDLHNPQKALERPLVSEDSKHKFMIEGKLKLDCKVAENYIVLLRRGLEEALIPFKIGQQIAELDARLMAR